MAELHILITKEGRLSLTQADLEQAVTRAGFEPGEWVVVISRAELKRLHAKEAIVDDAKYILELNGKEWCCTCLPSEPCTCHCHPTGRIS